MEKNPCNLKDTILSNLIQFLLGFFLVCLVLSWFYYPLGIYYENLSAFGRSISPIQTQILFLLMCLTWIFINASINLWLFSMVEDIKLKIALLIQLIMNMIAWSFIYVYPQDLHLTNHMIAVGFMFSSIVLLVIIFLVLFIKLGIFRFWQFFLPIILFVLMLLGIMEGNIDKTNYYTQRFFFLFLCILCFTFQNTLKNEQFKDQLNFFKN